VGDQDNGSPGRPVSSALQVPGESGHCSARTRPRWWPSRGVFFLQNVLQLHQQRWVTLRVDSSALWKIINEEDAVLNPKNRDENFSSGFLHSEFFGVGWAAVPPLHWLLLCLWVIVTEPGFVHGQQSRQEIIWIAPKKFQRLLRRLAPLTFLIRVQALRDPRHGELPHVQIFMNDGPNPLTWDAQLLSYWFSRNPAVFQDKIVNLINNLRGGHFWVVQDEAHHRWKSRHV